jgi:20S proteasome alpha/beta subunit
MGARCKDGMVLVADTKLTSLDRSHVNYGNKITGETVGFLTAFSGDQGTFELFTNRVRNYVKTSEEKRLDQMLGKGFIGLRILQFNPDLDQALWELHQIKKELFAKSRGLKFDLLTGVSSIFFNDKKSVLYYFDVEGGYIPENRYKAIGEGEPYASYYLKRYYEDNMTMKKFASLGDFIIRYIDNEKYRLNDSVGLEAKFPYPQIKYIPDDPEYCKPYNNGRPKTDCSPTGTELEEFKSYSEKKLQSLHDQPF